MLLQVKIVSAEKLLYTGEANCVVVTAENGELGILPQHAPLLARLKPGQVRVLVKEQPEEVFYISGGMLEVQPDSVTVLADTAERAESLDEAAAIAAMKQAEEVMQGKQGEFDYAEARAALIRATAVLATIRKLRERH
ncbi:MAG: F0F1 ATP synthase subunit epsilon [Gammaproteobacteria bacterium]